MPKLLGRQSGRHKGEQLLSLARDGHSGTLVVRGEAGIGKTALLEHFQRAAAPDFRVESSTGIEAEMQFAFAGLHQLCAPMLDRLDALPEPQQVALEVAFGIRYGPTPDKFLVALATLHLLAEVAEHHPLLCLIDDAQWLDQASTEVLAFVARRIGAERIALVFAIRESGDRGADPFLGLPELYLTGLDENDARALLLTAVTTPLGEGVHDRIVAEARGNPLALLEYPRSIQPSLLAGGFELPDTADIPRRVECSFQQRALGLPQKAQILLLTAAADPTGSVELLNRTAQTLDIGEEAIVAAEEAGLITIDSRVRFCHPLARSAIYRSATATNRRLAHHALAKATDPHADPDRRAWHVAQSIKDTDEDAADGLVRSAGRARARGGVAAAAAFLEYAARLTPDLAVRATRNLEAAHAKHDAGASESAQKLLKIAEIGPLDDLQKARLRLLRARTEFSLSQSGKVPAMLLDAAEELAQFDPALSRETYLHALDAAMAIASREPGHQVPDIAAAALAAPSPPEPIRPADHLLNGLVTTITQGYSVGAPELLHALEDFRERGFDGEETGQMGSRHWLWLACRTAMVVYDDESFNVLSERSVRLAREASAMTTLSRALDVQAVVKVLQGDIAHAAQLAGESAAIAVANGMVPFQFGLAYVSAWRGDEAETKSNYTTSMQGNGSEFAGANYFMAVLQNAQGNYREAHDAAIRSYQFDELVNTSLVLPEVIEAASRTGDMERAKDASAELGEMAMASGTNWAHGLAACARALTSDGTSAEENFRDAIDRLADSRATPFLARTHLLYGEWLRREGRRQAARISLRTAHEMLSDIGASGFADRAAAELRATGEHPRKRSAPTTGVLTPQELHISRLVATGATNREVGEQLFLSPRTIEAHLRNIFIKLDITSRRQLRQGQLP